MRIRPDDLDVNMREVDPETWPRKQQFETFRDFQFPHFNICADVDLTSFRPAIADAGMSFTAAFVYLIARSANEVPEFRLRIRGGAVVEHDRVHPSATILVDDDRFSFCTLDYNDDFSVFATHVAERIAEVKKNPTVAVVNERDDLLYMTAIPWVTFTSFSHPMPSLTADSVPRFTWQVHQEGDSIKMPLSVQAHHALMDGFHVGRYFDTIASYLRHPEKFLH
ncbi:MAG: chloramphenicol acetyltransferase [Actinomycetota bacterium]|nr:chloramphenicol acetyltransferase [Actinomycetota bacterium]